MRYIYWNTHNNNVDDYIIELVREYNPSIIALAEYDRSIENLISSINKTCDKDYSELPQLACKVNILIKSKISNVEHCSDNANYTIKIIPYNSYNDSHIVAFVHLPSKTNGDNNDKNRYILECITTSINKLEQASNRKVLIFGDFNLNPYENAMTDLTGCNAVSSRKVALKISRKDTNNNDKKFYYYYNPMWNYLGDRNDCHGTFYYNKTSMNSRYWNTFDQFVVSPELIKDIEDIKIIKDVGSISLANRNGLPKVSDHFPLYFKLGGN